MTITLVPEVETRLCERAARDGKDMEALANALLADHLLDDEAARAQGLGRTGNVARLGIDGMHGKSKHGARACHSPGAQRKRLCGRATRLSQLPQ